MIATSRLIHTAAVALLTQGAGKDALVAAGVTAPAGTSAKPGGVTTRPKQGQALPYVEVGQTTESERERSTSTRSAEVTHTCTVRAPTLDQAHAIAAVVVSTLGRRIDLPGPADGSVPYVTDATLDLYGPPIDDDGDPPSWTLPVRIRYRVHQPATSAE